MNGQPSELTVIIPNRNRLDPKSLTTQYLFKSIDNQNFTDFELLIVDGGSSNIDSLREFVRNTDNTDKINKSILYVKIGSIFEKSKLNNFGIKFSESKYVMTTDADMFFDKMFMETVVENLRKSENIFVESRSLYWKQKTMEKIHNKELDPFNDIDSCKIGRIKYRTTCGGCQATSLKNWHRLRGYNETMIGWGSEDQELLNRAQIIGLNVLWLGEEREKIMLFHQHHDKPNLIEDLKHQERNKQILAMADRVVNCNGWGESFQ